MAKMQKGYEEQELKENTGVRAVQCWIQTFRHSQELQRM